MSRRDFPSHLTWCLGEAPRPPPRSAADTPLRKGARDTCMPKTSPEPFQLADHICLLKVGGLLQTRALLPLHYGLCSLGNFHKVNSNFKSHFLCFRQKYLRCFLLRILGASWLQAPMPTKFTKEPVPIQSENIARVANAVQVTLWVLVTNLNVMIFVPQFVTNGQLCHFTLSH